MNSHSSHNISRRESSLVTEIIQGSGLLTVEIYVRCVYVGLSAAGFLLRPGLPHKKHSLILCGPPKQKTVPLTSHKLLVNCVAFFSKKFQTSIICFFNFILLMLTGKKEPAVHLFVPGLEHLKSIFRS